MSVYETTAIIIAGFLVLSSISILFYFYVRTKNTQKERACMKNRENLATIDLAVLNLPDESARNLFIAGLNVVKSITNDDYSTIFKILNIQ